MFKCLLINNHPCTAYHQHLCEILYFHHSSKLDGHTAVGEPYFNELKVNSNNITPYLHYQAVMFAKCLRINF